MFIARIYLLFDDSLIIAIHGWFHPIYHLVVPAVIIHQVPTKICIILLRRLVDVLNTVIVDLILYLCTLLPYHWGRLTSLPCECHLSTVWCCPVHLRNHFENCEATLLLHHYLLLMFVGQRGATTRADIARTDTLRLIDLILHVLFMQGELRGITMRGRRRLRDVTFLAIVMVVYIFFILLHLMLLPIEILVCHHMLLTIVPGRV